MANKKVLELGRVLEIQRKFVKDRDWEQFHTAKNIVMALGIEAAELAEVFLWVTEREAKKVMGNPKKSKRVREELADVFYWVLRLSDVLGIDLGEAFLEKMGENAKKYPVRLSKGRMAKYTEL